MTQTYFGSGIRSGSGTLTDTTDGGFVVLMQTVTVTSNSTGAVSSGSVTVPENSQIIDISAEKIVNWDVGAGTANALNIRVGSASNGAQYMPTTNVATTNVTTGSLTVANLLARSNVANNIVIYCSVDPDGNVANTQAQILFNVLYAQKT